MLRGAFELRHQGYLWIADLTSPDHLIALTPFKLPLLGWEVDAINLLPVLYLGLILLQQHLSPKSEDPQVRQQQSMMKFMMMFFFLIFYKMPSGLVLYFVFSNGVGIIEQWYIRKHVIPAATGAGGAGGAAVPAANDKTFQGPAPRTSWEKQEEKAKRKAEKRKKRQDRQGPLT
jgi:YidC/Oxa1 family membrane protein insertase